MRSKTILSIVAFIAAFGFSAAFASLFITQSAQTSYVISDFGSQKTSCFSRYQSQTAREISSLLRQDVSNGRERDRNLREFMDDWRTPFGESNFDEFTVVMQEYVDSSSSLDAGDLPSDFQNAWNEHINAWRDYSEFLNNVQDSSQSARFSNEKLMRLDSKYTDEINATWYEVLRVGNKYGARAY